MNTVFRVTQATFLAKPPRRFFPLKNASSQFDIFVEPANGGDIDDLQFDDGPEAKNCTCCENNEQEYEDDYYPGDPEEGAR